MKSRSTSSYMGIVYSCRCSALDRRTTERGKERERSGQCQIIPHGATIGTGGRFHGEYGPARTEHRKPEHALAGQYEGNEQRSRGRYPMRARHRLERMRAVELPHRGEIEEVDQRAPLREGRPEW